ncbi:MAG: hypothetical protein GXP09_09465 [Gammaproteobacteria bacterium]|nr:hypothetical protein [Gammaproteobacteria bacterium]
MNVKKTVALVVLCLIALPAFSSSDDEVDGILTLAKAPPGVVFELLGDDDSLKMAIPKILEYIEELRTRFPELAVAIVSHGDEQFALMAEKADSYPEVHDQVESLVEDQDVQVHVCATYARWSGVSPEEFPEFVDVVPQGPSQIKDYVEFGYVLVEVDM